MSVDLTVPAPTVVEVEVNSRCNRRCGYCPVSVLPIPKVPRLMDDAVFTELLRQLSDLSFDGRLSYHFYNEPLIRKDLERLVARAAAALPAAEQVLFTNGDLLTDARYASLVEAGVDHFVVTRHAMTPIAERDRQTVLFPVDLRITNRGGLMFDIDGPVDAPCFAPSEMLIVTVTGDVVLCYEDAERRNVMGNIMESTVAEIWCSERFCRIRDALAAGDRGAGAPICTTCSNRDHDRRGRSHTASWTPEAII